MFVKKCTTKTLLCVTSLLFSATSAFAAEHPQLDNAQAAKVIESVKSTLAEQHSTGCVAIVDSSGSLLAFERLDGSPAGCVDASIGKARTSALYHAPSLKFMQRLAGGETTVLAIPHAVALGGGFPLTLNGEVVGAVGVSTPKQEIDNQSSEKAASVLK
ncbi:GlcG/HbpS family heme-binding protein [Rahnella sp. PCH160]|uniref:GlcG/HbpS family heme-binding protein n=1 Tax=Rahnella sp. PCH160 TaxID=3447928 RepID=UPI0039FCBA36